MRKLIDAQFGAVKASPKIRVDDNSYDIPIEKIIHTFLNFIEISMGVTSKPKPETDLMISVFKESKLFHDMINKRG